MNGAEKLVEQGTASGLAQFGSATAVDGPSLLILAAGMGSRFGGLKQIEPVNAAGEAILDYSVFDAARAGFRNVVFVIRREIEDAFNSRMGRKFDKRVCVRYAYQELDSLLDAAPPLDRTRPWGTLQATLVGAEQIDGPFAVINADDFYGADSYKVLAGHLLSNPVESATVGFRLRHTLSPFGPVSRGVCGIKAGGLLARVNEMKKIIQRGAGAVNTADDGSETALSGDETVSMNMWGFTQPIVPHLRRAFQAFQEKYASDLKAEAYLPEAVNGIVSAGKAEVAVLHTEAAWCGMTYREDESGVVEHIQRLTREGRYPAALWT